MRPHAYEPAARLGDDLPVGLHRASAQQRAHDAMPELAADERAQSMA
jgi:hypothetical protein